MRSGQGLAPTDFALGLTRPLADVLDGVQALVGARSRWRPETATEVIRLSGIDFWSEMLMPQLGRKVLAEAPGLQLQLLDLVPGRYVAMLDDQRIDIGLMPWTEALSWIESRPLFWSPFVTIARADHPRLARAGLAPGETIPLDLFCDLAHILLSPDGKLSAMGDSALARVGRERRVAMTVPFLSGVARLVAESDAVALVPRQFAEAQADERHVSLYRPPIDVGPALLTMVWHRRTTSASAQEWIRQSIVELTQPLNAGLPALPS